MTNLRFQVVEEAFKKKPLDVQAPSERPYEYFGKKVFNREKMYKYLPKQVYEQMIDVIDNGARLDRAMADAVAAGMMQWAKENGVTHYTHWFQPLTEGTAEKHDSFIEHDGKGGMIEEFSASCWLSRSPMHPRSRQAVSVPPLKPAAILHGTPHRPSSSSTIRFASLRSLSLIPAKPWTTKHRCCEPFMP